MKLIIAGGRTFSDYDLLYEGLEPYRRKVKEVVSGHANGADKMGEQWAAEFKIPVKLFPADWAKYGKGAGYVRNKEMAEYGDELVAFWNGHSKGTWNMISLMEDMRKPFHWILYHDHNRV